MDAVEMIQIVAKALQDLKEDVVFIGGAAVALYFDGAASWEIRPTDDVDCVIELTTRSQYYKLEQQLREKGFQNVVDKILQAPSSVKKYLQKSFKEMLETQDFHEAIYAHLPERQFQEEKKKQLVGKIEKLV